MGTPADSASGRILALDGWRGISVLMVVFGHIFYNRYGIARVATNDVGVLIFFAISGFIITKLAIAEYAKYGHFSVGRFYIRRSLRILPPFFVYLAFVFGASMAGLIEQSLPQVFKAGAFMCISGFILPCEWFVAHSSSLGYEEMFYLLFPLIFFCFAQRPLIIFGSILIGLATFVLLRRTLQLEVSFVTVTAGLFLFICSGAVAATLEPAVSRLARTPLGTGLWFVSAAIVIAKIVYSSNYQVPVTTIIHAEVETPLPSIFKLLPLATVWLVVGSLYGSSRLFTFLTWRPLVWIGQISYSLYLWQQIFTAAPKQLYPTASLLLFPPLMFVAAAASYYWIELPCRGISKRLMTTPAGSIDNSIETRSQLPP